MKVNKIKNNGKQVCTGIKSCLHQLHRTGIIIKTLTFDGAANNLSMTSLLGAILNNSDLKPNFEHPSIKKLFSYSSCYMVENERIYWTKG